MSALTLLLIVLCCALAVRLMHTTFAAAEWRTGYDAMLYSLGIERGHAIYWRHMHERIGDMYRDAKERKALWRALKSIQNHKERWLLALEHNEWLNERIAEIQGEASRLAGAVVDATAATQRAYGMHAVLVDKLESAELLAKHYEHGRGVMRTQTMRLIMERAELRQQLLAVQTRLTQSERQVEVLTEQLGKVAGMLNGTPVLEQRKLALVS